MGFLAKVLWYIVIYAVAFVPALLLDGYAVMKLYQWFIATFITNAPTLHLVAAIGLSLFVGFITRAFIIPPKGDGSWAWAKHQLWYSASYMYLSPLTSLVIGWVLHSYFL